MDLLESAKELRREAEARRRALAVVLAVAVACGALVFLRPGLPPETRQYEVWHADGQLLVDTSDSQVVDARAIGIETLAIRAILLGNLIATSPLRDGIAQRAGLDPDELEVTPPASTTPTKHATAPERSIAQRMDALKRANDVRTKRAQLKRDLKAGHRQIHELLLDPPSYIETAKVFDLLLAVPKYGRVKTNKVLMQCRISPSKTIGGLSPRQRAELVALLRR